MANHWKNRYYWIMTYRSLHRLPLALLLVLVATWTLAAPIPDFEVQYTLRYEGIRVGEAVYRLRQQGDEYLYESRTRPVGIAAWFRKVRVEEHSQWTWHEDRIRPLQYLYRRTGGRSDRDAELIFDWEALQVENRVAGHPWQMDIPPHALDKMVVTLVLMRDLASGARDVEYAIADGGRLKTYRFKVVGEERVETPAGTFDALKLERLRDDNKRYTALWCAPELHYLPVKLLQREDDDRLITSELHSVSDGLRKTAPAD
jgi:hypothetical protein